MKETTLIHMFNVCKGLKSYSKLCTQMLHVSAKYTTIVTL